MRVAGFGELIAEEDQIRLIDVLVEQGHVDVEAASTNATTGGTALGLAACLRFQAMTRSSFITYGLLACDGLPLEKAQQCPICVRDLCSSAGNDAGAASGQCQVTKIRLDG